MRRLLIADDESGIRRLVRMTLENEAYEILEASDGYEALAVARGHSPALMLLDINMPRRSGIDVCRTLKKDPATRDIAIVMLTANALVSEHEEALAAGADDYFTKPFSPVALLRKVDDVFEGQFL
jgi:CheY-like chemotaxis protein